MIQATWPAAMFRSRFIFKSIQTKAEKPPDISVKSQQYVKCELTLILPHAVAFLKAIILLGEWTWCPWLCSLNGWKQSSSSIMYQKVRALTLQGKKIITRTTWSWKERKWNSIFMSSLSAWKFTDQWNLTLQVQGADYTPYLISSLLHGSLLHTALPLDFLAPQLLCGWAISLLKCWITRWKLPVRVPLIRQASWCWKHPCCVISQVLMMWVARLQKSLT